MSTIAKRRLATAGVLAIAAGLAVCGLSRAEQQPPQRDPLGRFDQWLERRNDVVFSHVGDRELHLDLAWRKDRPARPLPVVVWIHGGGWRNGSHHNPSHLHYAMRGYVTANIEYRLSGEAVWPAQIFDCKAALRWLRAHAGEYGIDPDKVAVAGSSAGGHLALMLGTSQGVKELEGDLEPAGEPAKVACVVDFYGPANMLTIVNQPSHLKHAAPDSPESRLLGKPILEASDLAKQASPIAWVDQDDPPTLLLHGLNDQTVPHEQSEEMYQALQAAGVESTLKLIDGAGHGGREFGQADIMELVDKFLDDHLNGGTPPVQEAAGG